MADSLDEYLARKRQGGTAVPAAQVRQSNDSDPLEAYLAKRRPPPAPPVIDVGPEARRARAGMPAERHQTAEEAGTMSGPQTVVTTKLGPNLLGIGPDVLNTEGPGTVQAARAALSPEEQRALPDADARARGDMVRFLGSTAVGGVAGRAAGGAVGAAAPRLAPIAEGAAGGGVTAAADTAASGGSAADVARAAGTGAALGGAVAAVPQAVDVVATGASKVGAALGPGAARRVQERTQRNLTEPVGQRVADKVTRVMGEEGERLAPVLARNPQLRKALALEAKDNPQSALRAVKATKDIANAERHADFEQMQAYHADKPPSSQATIAGILDDYDQALLRDTADLDRYKVLSTARAEVQQLGDRLRKAQGLPPAVEGDYSGTVITPKDLRSLEQTIGRRAYEQGTPTSVKAKVNSELYAPIARQVNALADATPGVDAKRFANTGQDIHVLIPVEESLAANVKSIQQGRPTWRETVRAAVSKVANIGPAGGIVTGFAIHSPEVIAASAVGLAAAAAHKVAGKVGRRIDFRLSEAQRQRTSGPPAPRTRTREAPEPSHAGVAAGVAASQDPDALSGLY